jgi:hypothetical protein
VKYTFQLLFILLSLTSLGFAKNGIPLNPIVSESLGVDIHFTTPQPGEMEELAAAGIRWVRMDFFWQETERVKGQYDFSAYDRLLRALEPYHIWPILIFCYSNPLYDHGLSPHTPAGREAFARWAAAAARHFRGRGVVWEMYNEPNGYFWKPKRNDGDYIKLALAVGEALRENTPDATYIGPAGAMIGLGFLKECFAAGLLNYWDAVSVHPYRQRVPESTATEYAELRKLIATYAPKGKSIPIIAGEWGYSGTWLWPGMSNTLQANLLAREFLSDLAEGVPLTIWYDWRNDGTDPNNQEANFGLVEFPYQKGRGPVFKPKPAYFALQTLARALSGYRFSKRFAIGGPQDYILLFTRAQEQRLVIWTAAWQPHQITIRGARGRFTVTDVEGRQLRPLHARHHELKITLTDAPKYLTSQKVGGFTNVVHR